MRSLLYKIFVQNWQRKLIALILAMVIWILVNHSIITSKTVHNVPIKIINIPKEKTVKGLSQDGILKSFSLCLTGDKYLLEELHSNDLLVVLDAEGKGNQWVAQITPQNLVCRNSKIDIKKAIIKINHPDLIIKLSNLVTDKISITITDPIGEPPPGFRYVDIWPYRLTTHITGPEEVVKALKTKSIKLTFNLGEISVDDLQSLSKKEDKELMFTIPEEWKYISLPELSFKPIRIDDRQAAKMRVNFIKDDLIPLNVDIPISLFFSPHVNHSLPDHLALNTNPFIKKINGVNCMMGPFYAKEVSPLFANIIKNRIQIVVIASSLTEKTGPLWNVQFIYPNELEDRYVTQALNDAHESGETELHLREEYLRNRFRNYMNRFRIHTADGNKLHLDIQVQSSAIDIQPSKDPSL